MRSAMRGGVVPGGGAAYLACCPALEAILRPASCEEERVAIKMLIRALHAPLETLMANAGIPAGEALEQIEIAGQGYGYDLVSNRVVDMLVAGIYDAAPVAKAVVCGAIRGAALALTTQVLVHRRNPPDASLNG